MAKAKRSALNEDRRRFLQTTARTAALSLAGAPTLYSIKKVGQQVMADSAESGQSEVLYNGIQLPSEWPPRSQQPDSYDPMPLPYISSPPLTIPIDVGRQLFVDEFLIEKTDLQRSYHQPVKYDGNPILRPKTRTEMNQGYCPMAAPFSDGCFYDPKDQLYKLWYMSGWFDGTALATSRDGIHWRRPNYDVVRSTNLVLTPGESRDGVSVWIDHDAQDESKRFKMYRFERVGKIGTELSGGTGHILTSPDGVHWQWKGQVGKTGDNSTFFYNPFRKKWVFTIRAFGRAVPPWSPDTWNGSRRGRARSYWEHSDFEAAIGGWKEYEPVFWLGADRLDNKRVGYQFGREPQLYKIDAVGYESLMIGLLQLHYGPPNEICAESGFPKLTELHLAFSRDGFHWDRTNRATFIGATLDPKSWERAYIHSVGGVCSIFEDKIYFYYTAFQGNDKNHHQLQYWSGMYANASTGVAMLRRDGFASMDANHTGGTVITRKLKSNGRYLFVNVDAEDGELRAEICFEDGNPIPGYQLDQCVAIRKDTTKQMIHWQGDKDLEMITDQRFRIRFHLVSAKLYSFWVSQNIQGKSGGATAAGGPGLTGTWDK